MTGEQETPRSLADQVREVIDVLGEEAIADFAADFSDEDGPDTGHDEAMSRMLGVLASQQRATHQALILIAEELDKRAEAATSGD